MGGIARVRRKQGEEIEAGRHVCRGSVKANSWNVTSLSPCLPSLFIPRIRENKDIAIVRLTLWLN